MGFFRLILLIMLFSALSLTGLVGLGTILPDEFGTGSGLFLLYVVGVSLTFLFFLKKHSGGRPSEGGKEPQAERTPEAKTQHSSEERLEDVRDRIRDRKRPRK